MSHDNCHGGQCDAHGHHHGECGQQHDCCSCHSCTCSCHKGSCCEDKHGSFAHQLLDMADEAWMEVLKDKIKEQVKGSSDKQLEELAKIVAEANQGRWKRKMSSDKACHDFGSKIDNFFHRDS